MPPHVEVALQIHAADTAALVQDRYRLLVRGGSRAAGTTTGRFLAMLDESDLTRFRDAYTSLATVRPGAVAVQLSQPPLRPAETHLAGAPALLPQVLSIGEFTDQTTVVRTADLAVSGDIHGLFLIHLPDQRVTGGLFTPGVPSGAGGRARRPRRSRVHVGRPVAGRTR